MHRIEKKMEKSMKENCGKIENILNLALDATREEREKSLNLDVGYDVADDSWEVIVKFFGTTEELRQKLSERFPEEQAQILSVMKKRLRCRNAVLLNPYGVFICDTESGEEEFLRQVQSNFAEVLVSFGCRANVSYPFAKLRELYGHYRQTLHCIRMRQALGMDEILLRYDDVIDYHMVFSFGKVLDADTMIHPAVRVLLETDEENDSDYAQTLFTYISCSQNLSDAAKEMGLHYNTLKYRMNRIVAMTGLDLKDERTIFKLMVTKRALRLLESPGQKNFADDDEKDGGFL